MKQQDLDELRHAGHVEWDDCFNRRRHRGAQERRTRQSDAGSVYIHDGQASAARHRRLGDRTEDRSRRRGKYFWFLMELTKDAKREWPAARSVGSDLGTTISDKA
jgi:hypothetical protein